MGAVKVTKRMIVSHQFREQLLASQELRHWSAGLRLIGSKFDFVFMIFVFFSRPAPRCLAALVGRTPRSAPWPAKGGRSAPGFSGTRFGFCIHAFLRRFQIGQGVRAR